MEISDFHEAGATFSGKKFKKREKLICADFGADIRRRLDKKPDKTPLRKEWTIDSIRARILVSFLLRKRKWRKHDENDLPLDFEHVFAALRLRRRGGADGFDRA